MIKFISGNILDATSEFIAQGVATGSQEGLGTGLALKISKKWPEAQKAFKKYTRNNKFVGGDIFIVQPNNNCPGIIYIATQPDMYHAELSFLERGIRNLARYCVKHSVNTVSLPKIGAGLGKLDWDSDIKPIFIKRLKSLKTIFFAYEKFKNEYEIKSDTRKNSIS